MESGQSHITSCGFLDLPLEVRYLVYEHCSNGYDSSGQHGEVRLSWLAGTDGVPKPQLSLPMPKAILHISRQIRREILGLLCRDLHLDYVCTFEEVQPPVETVLTRSILAKVQTMTVHPSGPGWHPAPNFVDGMESVTKMHVDAHRCIYYVLSESSSLGPEVLTVEGVSHWVSAEKGNIEQLQFETLRSRLEAPGAQSEDLYHINDTASIILDGPIEVYDVTINTGIVDG